VLIDANDGSELSKAMTKGEMYSNLFCLCSLYDRVHSLQLKHFQEQREKEKRQGMQISWNAFCKQKKTKRRGYAQ
jgi:hypothetical protein